MNAKPPKQPWAVIRLSVVLTSLCVTLWLLRDDLLPGELLSVTFAFLALLGSAAHVHRKLRSMPP